MNLKKNSKHLSINNLFLDLVRVSIGAAGCLSRTPSEAEWGKLYKLAQKQSLVGVCFAGLQKLGADADEGFARIGMSEMQYLTWMGMAAKIQQKNEVVSQQCVELQARLSADGFRSYIMKGQAVGSLYGSLSALRQSGDIDVYLEGGFEKVNEYVQRTYPTKEINELEIHYPCFPDTEVEIHFKPFVMDGPKDRVLQKFFDSCAEENFNNHINISTSSDSLTICAPTLKFNFVHQLVHIHHHMFYEGVGMRQLMDYYMVLRTVPSSKLQEVSKVVLDLDLERFASALMWVLGHVFGLPEEKMPWSPCEKDGRFLLKEIMLSGNFGKQDKRQKGLYDNKWNSFWMVHIKTFRLWRLDHWAWLWSPIWRIRGFLWRKLKGFK